MKNKILIFIFLIILSINTTVYAQEQAVIDKFQISLDQKSDANSLLGDSRVNYYPYNSTIYEFWDENNQYNIIYELYNDNSQMGWLVVDSTLKNKVKEIYIEKKLPIFGNAIYKDGYLYVVYGKNDTTTTSSTSLNYATSTTIEIVKYNTSGNIVEDLPISGKETSRITTTNTHSSFVGYGTAKPFDSGNCDIAINSKGIIKVVFNREMYNGHTSSFAIYVDSNNLEYLNRPSTMDFDNIYYTLNNSYYVSHSFSERVIADSKDEFVSVDLGDGYPRAFLLAKPYSGTTNLLQLSKYEVFHFREGNDTTYGYNKTFASLGNIIEVDDGYILVAASEKTLSLNYAPNATINESRNIFIQKYNLDLKYKDENSIQMFNTELRMSETERTSIKNKGSFYLSDSGETDYGVKWLTNYEDKLVTEVRAIKINDNKVLILWAENDLGTTSSGVYTISNATRKFYYMIIDKDGNIVKNKTTINRANPTVLINYVYKDGYIYWTDNSEQTTMTINKLNVNATEEEAYINRVGEEDIIINDANITTKKLEVNTNKDVNIEWKSSNIDVATVDENGLVTINNNGNATITATLEGYDLKVTWNLEVNYLCQSVIPNQNEIEVKVGTTKKILVTINPTNAKNKKINWHSENEEIVTIYKTYSDGSATILANNVGETNIVGITEDGSNIKTTVKIKVVNPITSINIENQSITVQKGKSQKINYTINPTDASEKIIWDSQDKNIATVDENGNITGISGGSTYITASTEYYNYKRTIYVKVESPMTGLDLEKKNIYLTPGDSYTLKEIYYPSDQTDLFTTQYSIDNSKVISIDSNGKITAKENGTATVTITTSNGFTTKCTVTVGDYLKGDMNKDGNISITDVIKLLRIYLELDNKEEDTITIGDMNNSGDITITDVIILLRKYLELE